MSDVAVVLRKARDLYAANPSHCAAERHSRRGTYCPLTAVYAVSEASTLRSVEAKDALSSAAGTLAIAEWNARSSTKTVLAAFDKAITEADNA
jgi:hypothetical protein